MVEDPDVAEKLNDPNIPNPNEPDKPYPTPPLRIEYTGGVVKIIRDGNTLHAEAVGIVSEFAIEYGGES